MNSVDIFRNVEEKVANQLGCSVEELKQQYDKQIITDNTNKDGQQLFMFRILTSKEIVSGTYSNTARYMIYTQEGEYAGYIDVMVSNRKEANEAEIQYASNEKFRNKGNMTISLEEVLREVFVDKSFDGLQIKPFFPKTEMKKVFLAINEDNYASQAVAKKSGFIKNGECYEITRDEFIRKISDEKQQEIGKASVILDENCNEKVYEPSKEVELQKFNYHTHTSLCGHADGTMEEYIKKAIEGGITDLGFSDHMPNPLGKGNPKQSMNLEQFHSQYIPMLEELREKYKDQINLKIGLECEYYGEQGEQFPQLKKFREETESKLDYMILGQHFALKRDESGKLKMPPEMSSKTSSQYPLDYAMTVVEAIKSGKFAYVAHPDIFLEGRDGVPEEEKALYLENAKKATQMICEVASKNNIPLEVNLGSISAIEAGIKNKMQDGSYAYPVPEFWKVAQAYGCKALIGMDAHTPDALREKDTEIIAKRLLEDKGIELDYLENYEPRGIEQNIGEKEEIRTEQDYTITPNQIGKKSIYDHIGKKDIAKGVVDRKIEEGTNPQELDTYNHNGSQGGTNDGR